MFSTILPNCAAPLIVQATLGFSNAILDAAALGFLGLGAQPPTPEWGSMLASALEFIQRAPWVVTFPGKHEFYPTVTPVAPYSAVLTSNGACETALFTFFDRDEQSANPPTTGFSPQQPGAAPNTGGLCWESTVMSIRNGQAHTSAADISSTAPRSGVLGSRNVLAVSQTSPAFSSGRASSRWR
jgi:hypothetical protein